MRAKLIINPTSGQGKAKYALPKIIKYLESNHVDLEVGIAKRPGDGSQLALESVEQGLDIVIVAGGDGTLNEVANGLAGSKISLGIIPLGTGNVFAREMKIPFRLDKACEVICKGAIKTVDLGKAGERYFLSMAGIGFDAQVVYDLRLNTKKLLGSFAYVLNCFKTGIRYGSAYVEMNIWADGNHINLPSWLVVIGNGSCYAWNLKPAILAKIDDGLLDVCVFKIEDWLGILRQAVGVFTSTHIYYRGVNYIQAKSITIDSLPPVPIQIDGDFLGKTPLNFTIVPKALLVKVPN